MKNQIKSVKNVDIRNKRVFVRVDYNVPMDNHQNITDDNRIRATLDLIDYLREGQAKIILASHLGRPKNGPDKNFSLSPVSQCLASIIKQQVFFVNDCIGQNVKSQINKLEPGQILMLENLRFYPGEKKNDPEFARQLAELCDLYVNDAFAVSHRDQASVTGIVKFVPEACAGFLLEKELKAYANAVENPERPLVALIGGAKISTKLAALENILNFVDKLIIGGAMANTFLKSLGIDVKASFVETDLLETAKRILDKAEQQKIQVMLPLDLVVAEKFDKDSPSKTVALKNIPENWMALDIGPETAKTFSKTLESAKTIIWNGPMGVFEMPPFLEGTKTVALAIAASKAFSIAGGGDTGLAAKVCQVADKIDYISTGGGAFLHLMEGKELPGAVVLEN